MAVAHSMIVIAFHLPSRDGPHRDLGATWYLHGNEGTHTQRLVAHFERLGHTVAVDAVN